MRNTIIAVAFGGAATLFATAVEAQSPETPYAPTPAILSIKVPIATEEPVIRWEAVGDVAHFQITGIIFALRVNADDPICTPPLVRDTRRLELDELLDGNETGFPIPLPVAEPDVWFISDTDVRVVALDADGQTIMAGSVGGIAETNRQCSTPTVPPILPETGAGPPRDAAGVLAPLLAVLALGLGLVTLGAFWLQRRA